MHRLSESPIKLEAYFGKLLLENSAMLSRFWDKWYDHYLTLCCDEYGAFLRGLKKDSVVFTQKSDPYVTAGRIAMTGFLERLPYIFTNSKFVQSLE